MSADLPYIEWNLSSSGLLPLSWNEEIEAAILKFGRKTLLTGESDQSREIIPTYRIEVIVVTGEFCSTALPWLDTLYKNDIREFVSSKMGRPYYPARDLRSSVNINCLRGVGARYETHVDTNPITGVLFASDVTAQTGGELIFLQPDLPPVVVQPRKGVFIAFDGRNLPHFVSPLNLDMDRISIPMNYYDDADVQHRPPDLDNYLYGEAP